MLVLTGDRSWTIMIVSVHETIMRNELPRERITEVNAHVEEIKRAESWLSLFHTRPRCVHNEN